MNALKPKKVVINVEEKVEEVPPLAVKETQITRDGLMTLAFNQDIQVPAFKEKQKDKKRRDLLEMSTFDLRRVIGLSF